MSADETWLGRCLECGRENVEVSTDYDHAAKVLCARCAARPHRLPRVTDADLAGVFAEDRKNGRQDTSVYELLSVAQARERLKKPEWLIEGLVPKGTTILFGKPGALKSFVAVDWAMTVAVGGAWCGMGVEPGLVVYVAAEDPGGIRLRADAWLREHGHPDDSRFRLLPEAVNLHDREQVARLARTLALQQEPALLVLDTLARSMVGADENSSRDVGAVLDAVCGLPARSLLVVHHTARDGALPRGSSALDGAADLMVRLDRHDGEAAAEMACAKPPKNFAEWAPLTLRARQVGWPENGENVTSLVLERVNPFDVSYDDLDELIVATVAEHGQLTRTRVEKETKRNAATVRQRLDVLTLPGGPLVSEPGKRNSINYSLAAPRPDESDGVETGSCGAPLTAPRPEGEHTPRRGVPIGDGVGSPATATASVGEDGDESDPDTSPYSEQNR